MGKIDAENWREQRIDDGYFEVFGLYSSFHIAQLQVGLSEPIRLGQGRRLSLRIFHRGRLPMQVDGEPWEQGPGTLTVDFKCQATMLSNDAGKMPPSSDNSQTPQFR
jgi:diacylglycerol kinase (ATP)